MIFTNLRNYNFNISNHIFHYFLLLKCVCMHKHVCVQCVNTRVCICVYDPWDLWAIGSGTPSLDSETRDAQVPYIKWHNVCL